MFTGNQTCERYLTSSRLFVFTLGSCFLKIINKQINTVRKSRLWILLIINYSILRGRQKQEYCISPKKYESLLTRCGNRVFAPDSQAWLQVVSNSKDCLSSVQSGIRERYSCSGFVLSNMDCRSAGNCDWNIEMWKYLLSGWKPHRRPLSPGPSWSQWSPQECGPEVTTTTSTGN